MGSPLRGEVLITRARDWEADPLNRHTEAGGLVALLCNEMEAVLRIAEHLTGKAIGGRCEIADYGDRCTGGAVAIRWEDGFADDVCERHATNAADRGALVIRTPVAPIHPVR